LMREKSQNGKKKYRFLIVDDVKLCRILPIKLLSSSLRSYEEASDGTDAVEIVRESMLTTETFDAVLMDFLMPKMNGNIAAKEMREMGYTGKIFGITGNAMQSDIDDFISHGADSVFIKPLKVENYTLMLQQIESKYNLLHYYKQCVDILTFRHSKSRRGISAVSRS
jgi:CheY-like chemotaxis protein